MLIKDTLFILKLNVNLVFVKRLYKNRLIGSFNNKNIYFSNNYKVNVHSKRAAQASDRRTLKTTKNRKNCTLISRQWLNNKFQNFIISLLDLF